MADLPPQPTTKDVEVYNNVRNQLINENITGKDVYNMMKQGKFTPGTHIPIISPNVGINNMVDYAFLGAWNFKKEIFKKEKRYIENGGKFITHVPIPRIV